MYELLLPLAGAAAGALINKNDPFKGAAIGALGGAAAPAALGALGAGGAAAGAGGAASMTGLASSTPLMTGAFQSGAIGSAIPASAMGGGLLGTSGALAGMSGAGAAEAGGLLGAMKPVAGAAMTGIQAAQAMQQPEEQMPQPPQLMPPSGMGSQSLAQLAQGVQQDYASRFQPLPKRF